MNEFQFNLDDTWHSLFIETLKEDRLGFPKNNEGRKRALISLLYPPIKELVIQFDKTLQLHISTADHLNELNRIRETLFNKWKISLIQDDINPNEFSVGYNLEELPIGEDEVKSVAEFSLPIAIEENDIKSLIDRYQKNHVLIQINLTDDIKTITRDLIDLLEEIRERRNIFSQKSSRQISIEEGGPSTPRKLMEEDYKIIKMTFSGKTNEEIAKELSSFYGSHKTSGEISSRKWEILDYINNHNTDWRHERKNLMRELKTKKKKA